MSAEGNAGTWNGEELQVLIVDDEKDFVLNLEDILESRGYRVENAHSPKMACEKLNRFDAQVALLDIRLGYVDGINLIAELGKTRPGIICVMMTASGAIDTAIKALQEGAYDYLRKPFEVDDLLATLSRCFEKIRLETERKQLQTQLQQAQKMEAIGTLAGGIAHDFNNLLQAILGYTQMLLFDWKKEDPGFADLKGIEKAAVRASQLTSQLLTYGRKVESQLRSVDLNQEIIQVEKLLKRTIPKMIDIELNLNETLDNIHADPTRMEQVLMNLAVNARDAMLDGGKLIIGTDNVVLKEEFCRTHIGAGALPGRYVMLSVSDTGHGMDKETLAHIFEPFYTTKETGKGTGLGLAMVYGIVKSHSGYITCNSEAGSGTTIEIYLPIIEAATDEELGDEPEAMLEGGTETILLVDDESCIRDLGKQLLTRFGYTVLTSADGESALALYLEKKSRISLVILDLSMPGMGGQRCLEELMKTDPDVKVMIVSGYCAEEPKAEALKAGARGFISKPYAIKKMLKAIREVIDAE